jgi:uncharacterized RDD family membrane protein YckC
MTESGEAVELESSAPRWKQYELASIGTRLAALLIDGLLVSAVVIVADLARGAAPFASGKPDIGSVAVSSVVGAAYFVPQMVLRNGRTVGKRALHIRVVRASESPMTVWIALVREIIGAQLVFGLTIVAIWVPSVWLVGLLDYLWALWDPQYRTLHDLLARTRVVRDPR